MSSTKTKPPGHPGGFLFLVAIIPGPLAQKPEAPDQFLLYLTGSLRSIQLRLMPANRLQQIRRMCP